MPRLAPDDQLADLLGKGYADLRYFIKVAFPWGEAGTELEHFKGIERWMEEVADEISNQVVKNSFDGHTPAPVIYVSVASGNGCAKSTFAAMVNHWIMSTRPLCQGTITANTGTQLRTKTWAQVQKWSGLAINTHWYNITSESMQHIKHGSKWQTNAVTWNERNTQAFAGQHARGSTSFYIFDEASHIPDTIHDQAQGGLVDGEPMYFMFGNPGNRSGRLYKSIWDMTVNKGVIHRSVDSRACKFTNKAEIDKWVTERGEDSDWVRVHVKGLPPNADGLQFIDYQRVQEARRREVPKVDDSEPLIMGIDFARGGKNWNRITFRRGRDMRSIPSIGLPGEMTADTTLMISKCLMEIQDKRPDAVFGDAGGVGGPILDGLRQLVKGTSIIDVNFGGASPDKRFGNWRAYMYYAFKEWLPGGCIEDSEVLENEVTGPEFFHIKERMYIESKDDMDARGIASPDWGDSCVLTFAMKVPAVRKRIEAAQSVAQAIRRAGVSKTRVRGWMGV